MDLAGGADWLGAAGRALENFLPREICHCITVPVAECNGIHLLYRSTGRIIWNVARSLSCILFILLDYDYCFDSNYGCLFFLLPGLGMSTRNRVT